MSESEIPIEFEFEDQLILRGVLDRVMAPQIVEDIRSMLPFEGRTALLRDEMKITLGISRGNQKPVREVKRGDIAYMPLGDSLCIYLNDMRTFSPVNVLGRITSPTDSLEQLRRVRRGSMVTVRLAE
ncbi:MAG: cyclophilin-like fold protein [Candidatus Thorarchaeota archaeon]